ncbi:MAG: aminoglycoside phosphotransferase family protein [Dehalococcoidia bacterium]
MSWCPIRLLSTETHLTPAPTVPDIVRNNAIQLGAEAWLDQLPSLVAELEREWSMTVGRPYTDATEAFVAKATLKDGSRGVLKLLIPRDDEAARNEITFLRLADGDGCARLLAADVERDAMLLERLGSSLFEVGLPLAQRLEILCVAAQRLWRPAPDCGLPTGAERGRWLVEFITSTWEKLDRPCTERALTYALTCAERRIAAHDDERAVLATATFTSATRSRPAPATSSSTPTDSSRSLSSTSASSCAATPSN